MRTIALIPSCRAAVGVARVKRVTGRFLESEEVDHTEVPRNLPVSALTRAATPRIACRDRRGHEVRHG